jgi:hypothetical protein
MLAQTIVQTNMVQKEEFRKGYRFSRRTIDNLDYLIKIGVVRNETEAIDLAIEALASEYRTREKLQKEDVTIHEGKNQSYEKT